MEQLQDRIQSGLLLVLGPIEVNVDLYLVLDADIKVLFADLALIDDFHRIRLSVQSWTCIV